MPTMTFERDSSGRWQAKARTSAGELVAHGETLREARLMLEQLLRMRAPSTDSGEDRSSALDQ